MNKNKIYQIVKKITSLYALLRKDNQMIIKWLWYIFFSNWLIYELESVVMSFIRQIVLNVCEMNVKLNLQ